MKVNTQEMFWSDDGMHMYTGQAISGGADNYKSFGNPWEIDEQVFVDFFVDGTPVFQNTPSVRVSPDGTQLWLNLRTGTNPGQTRSYSLARSYEWDNAGVDAPSLLGSFVNGTVDYDRLESMNISPDGTIVIAHGNDAGAIPRELTMSPGYDIDSMAHGTDGTSPNIGNAFIPKSGNCIYVMAGASGKVINKHDMSASWGATTINATPSDTLDLSGTLGANIVAIYITEDRLFVIDDDDDLFQFNA